MGSHISISVGANDQTQTASPRPAGKRHRGQSNSSVQAHMRRCVIFGCNYATLVRKRKGESWQTQNGHFYIYITGHYCPVCGGGYG